MSRRYPIDDCYPFPALLKLPLLASTTHYHLTQHLVSPWYVKSSWVICTTFNLVSLSTVTQLYAASYALVFPAEVGLTATGPATIGLDFLPEKSFISLLDESKSHISFLYGSVRNLSLTGKVYNG